jgi:hypothetical protein
MQDDSRHDRTDGERPRAFALLDAGNDAATRLEGVEALGNPSSSMTGSERRIVDRLLRVVLTDENATVRAEAIDALYFHGDRYVDELVSRVADAVRRRDGDDPESVFLRWLTSGHPAYRMAGATGVGATGSTDASDATRRLREAFDDDDARVRARAVRSYATLGGEEVAPIRPLLRTPNRLVRRAAVDALVSLGTADAVDLLATAAADGGDRLRETVVDRLADLDRPASATILLDAIRDPSLAVRRAAATSLARLLAAGDTVRGREVRERLTSDRPFGSDGDGGPARLFYDVTAGSASTRTTASAEQNAMWLCGELVVSEAHSPDDAQEWLLDALAHADAYVADIAAAYLPRLDEPGLEQALRALAADEGADPDARARARSALRRIKAQTAAAAADRSLDYIYVRHPADYTEKRSQ